MIRERRGGGDRIVGERGSGGIFCVGRPKGRRTVTEVWEARGGFPHLPAQARQGHAERRYAVRPDLKSWIGTGSEEARSNRIEIPFDIARAPDDVFAFLTDFGQLTRWRQLNSLRLEPEGPASVGTRLFSTVNAMGRRMEFTNEIVEMDPERRVYDVRFLDGTFPIQSGWRVEPPTGAPDSTGLPSSRGGGS